MFTFLEMLALVESESSFGAFVCHRRPAGFHGDQPSCFSNWSGITRKGKESRKECTLLAVFGPEFRAKSSAEKCWNVTQCKAPTQNLVYSLERRQKQCFNPIPTQFCQNLFWRSPLKASAQNVPFFHYHVAAFLSRFRNVFFEKEKETKKRTKEEEIEKEGRRSGWDVEKILKKKSRTAGFKPTTEEPSKNESHGW